jgi:hypothetical protein
MFRLKPTEIKSNTSGSLVYKGVLEELTGEVWAEADVTKPTVYMSWPKAGFEIMPASLANVVTQLQGSATIASSPPMIVTLCVDEVDSLQIGTAALLSMINSQGTVINPASVTMEDDITTLDLSAITGDVTLYMTAVSYGTTVIADPNYTVIIDTIVTVAGNWKADNTVVKDWESIQYVDGTTVVVFPDEYSGTVRLLMDEGNILTEYTAASTTMGQVPGRYPAIGLDKNRYTIDAHPIVKQGSTYYPMSYFDNNTLSIVVPNWIYGSISENGMNNDNLPTNPALAQQDGSIRWSDIAGRPNVTVSDIEVVVTSGKTKLPNVPDDTNAALDLKADLVDGKVPASQLPSAVIGSLKYLGQYDADANDVFPVDPDQGDYHVISVAGTIDGNDLDVGDWIIYNGTSWDILGKDPSDELTAHMETYDHSKLANVPEDTNSALAAKADNAIAPVVQFACPSDTEDDNLHFELQLSTQADFAAGVVVDVSSSTDQTNWAYFDGTEYQAVPAGGVAAANYGNNVAYSIPAETVSRGTTYYARYRASDGVDTSEWVSQILFW